MDWNQFVTQFSKFVYNVLSELSHLINQIFASEIFDNLLAILKTVGKFFITALEAIVRVLKSIVK